MTACIIIAIVAGIMTYVFLSATSRNVERDDRFVFYTVSVVAGFIAGAIALMITGGLG